MLRALQFPKDRYMEWNTWKLEDKWRQSQIIIVIDQNAEKITKCRPDLIIINNKKRKRNTCRIVDFLVPADHIRKLKGTITKNTYLDLARYLKKLRNMKVTIVAIAIGALSTVNRSIQGLEDLKKKQDEWRLSKLLNY